VYKFIWGITVGIWLMVALINISSYDQWRDEIRFTVQECEKDLPQNQHCEPVITARVVE
jgi:hypothetical protein